MNAAYFFVLLPLYLALWATLGARVAGIAVFGLAWIGFAGLLLV